MKRIITIASRFERLAHRFRLVLNLVGIVCFVLITADYARFVDLPSIVTVPLWLVVLLNMFRWAIWEGIVRPWIQAPSGENSKTDGATSQPPEKD